MKSLTHRLFISLFSVLFLYMCPLFLLAQDPIQAPEGIPPESDYMMRQHQEQIEEIMKVSNPGDREKSLESFRKKLDPKSLILSYYENYFVLTVQAYTQAGNTAQAQALSRKMQKLFPNSLTTHGALMIEAFKSRNYAKAIQSGEKINSASPNQQTTEVLAQSYIAIKNADNAAKYSLKALEGTNAKQGAQYVAFLAGYYWNKRDIVNSAKYYNILLKAFPGSGPQGWDWNSTKISAYYTLAQKAQYVDKNYDAAIKEYRAVLKINPKHDASHAGIGMSHWRLQQLEEAMDAFAKAVVIGQTAAAKARVNLEQIYKPRNNNSVEGLDALLEKARAALQ